MTPYAPPSRVGRSERICQIVDCDRAVEAWDLCLMHYVRLQREGEPGEPDSRKRSRGKQCTIEGCDKRHAARGWCEMHYTRWLRHGDPLKTIEPASRSGRRYFDSAARQMVTGREHNEGLKGKPVRPPFA